MRDNKSSKMWNRIIVGLFLAIVLTVVDGVSNQAATVDFATKLTELQTKFPEDKYWNHVGMTTDNSDGYTDTACYLHKTDGVSHTYGTNGCVCNHFVNANHGGTSTQCMGFAYKLGYDMFGDTTWTVINSPNATQIADIRIGDIVRLDNNSHSVFVIARTGNLITVGEANYSGACQISWDRTIDLSTANITYYERAANYDVVLGDQTAEVTQPESTEATTEATTTQATAPADFTGWQLAVDGENYQYFKSGKLQKNKWITIKKKKYYVDEDGYRVTDFYDIDGYTYYFNDEGVMKKNAWFSLDGETYYANASGIVLKSQWLYYKGVLVYVTKDGSIARKEIVKIGSKQYYFDAKGKRSKGFKKVNGKYYYCNSSGVIQKKKWVTKNGKKYYLQKNGVRAQSKLLKIGKYRYYFNAKGQMVKNKRIVYDGEVYQADKKGRCKYVEDDYSDAENDDLTSNVY